MRLVMAINQIGSVLLLLRHYQRDEGHAVPLSLTAVLHFLFASVVMTAQHDCGDLVEPILWTLPLQAIHVAVVHHG